MKELSPGIFEMTMEEYIAFPATSRTEMVAARETGSHAKAIKDFPKDTTEPMRLGTATHMAFLEPVNVPKHFALYRGKPREEKDTGKLIYPKNVVRSGAHWEAHEKNALSQGMDPYLTVTKYEHALSMGEALRLHKKTANLFSRRPVQREIVFVFVIEVLGVKIPVKVRIDCLIQDEFPTVADLKTAASISDHAFIRAIIDRGYDIQAWLYRKAFITLTNINVTNFVIAAVEKEKQIVIDGQLTHAVRIFEMKKWLKGGQQGALEALGVIAQCIKSGSWPAYPERVEELDPPTYYLKQRGLQR